MIRSPFVVLGSMFTYARYYRLAEDFESSFLIEVPTRDPRDWTLPGGIDCFYYFDSAKRLGPEEGDGDSRRRSAMHYVGGKILNRQQVANVYGADSLEYHDMVGMGYDRLVQCRSGRTVPFYRKQEIYVWRETSRLRLLLTS